jgi:MYXO-CTERM domain-containing protein
VEDKTGGGRVVSEIQNGDSIKVESVNFLTGALSFSASVASGGAGGSIELHVGSATGMLLGTCTVAATGGWQEWENVSCDVSAEVTGIQDLYLVFKGGSGALFNLDHWQFTPKDPLPGTGGAGGMAGAGGMGAAGGTSSGGAAGIGGVGGSAGSSNVAGASTGGASSGAGGSGGVAGGTGGSAGRAAGGTAAAAGGAAAQGGALPSAGKSGAAGGPATPNVPEDSGCACTTHGRSSHGPHWALALFSLIGFAGLRRRHRARS